MFSIHLINVDCIKGGNTWLNMRQCIKFNSRLHLPWAVWSLNGRWRCLVAVQMLATNRIQDIQQVQPKAAAHPWLASFHPQMSRLSDEAAGAKPRRALLKDGCSDSRRTRKQMPKMGKRPLLCKSLTCVQMHVYVYVYVYMHMHMHNLTSCQPFVPADQRTREQRKKMSATFRGEVWNSTCPSVWYWALDAWRAE